MDNVHGRRDDKLPIKLLAKQIDRPDGQTIESASARHTLSDLAGEFEFFTTALVTATPGGFDRDPLIEFRRLHPIQADEAEITAIDYTDIERTFFRGIGVRSLPTSPGLSAGLVDWDRRLYMARRSQWIFLRDFVASIRWHDPRQRTYARLCFCEFKLLDPFAVRRGGVIDEPPTVPVTVFCVDHTHRFSRLAAPLNPFDPPYLVHDPPREQHQVEGIELLGPPLNIDAIRTKEL